MADRIEPDRWMHVRRADGISDELFDVIRAGAEILVAHATALLAVLHRLPGKADHSRVAYTFFDMTLSVDRTIATLPIAGASTLTTRALIENGLSYLLWEHIPSKYMEGLDEGLTETIDRAKGPETFWRAPATGIGFINADPELRKRFAF
jgi:hypothetical protein